ncbi:helix-turn-helix transcriptional regulator [Elizabethkingia anophelis]|uniref:DNA-binding protein n=1 Tax=Elizabethkingia anophelis TaxID=1117645 RepID=A0AAU8UTR4_9FLAO|nr:helix-turn-helix transcriptional regulator [Elizabethkingia anophelis]AQX00287.1 DNA-binding protein [Elizabethkingia anophelis]MCT3691147.1 helix-turn-helix transcriptional regulator [Elizabethkingia anophelis]MCT3728902.1 helix-turn-helix transcriptional regulator [Elizabethkingia anophelis]MCT3822930.1 helix-turn-helix transcriptional regulator [Elizabethkingia anophelis]MCT3843362.1 helix-turn-helix transcriptional regulator [Elizabethkingia anophelis]
MQEYNEELLELLGLQIGSIVRLERLKKKLSQTDLGLMIGTNNTTIGRIERYESDTSWRKLFQICQILEIEFNTLFNLLPLESIIKIIAGCVKLEGKLTAEKKEYYKFLEKSIYNKYKKLKS